MTKYENEFSQLRHAHYEWLKSEPRYITLIAELKHHMQTFVETDYANVNDFEDYPGHFIGIRAIIKPIVLELQIIQGKKQGLNKIYDNLLPILNAKSEGFIGDFISQFGSRDLQTFIPTQDAIDSFRRETNSEISLMVNASLLAANITDYLKKIDEAKERALNHPDVLEFTEKFEAITQTIEKYKQDNALYSGEKTLGLMQFEKQKKDLVDSYKEKAADIEREHAREIRLLNDAHAREVRSLQREFAAISQQLRDEIQTLHDTISNMRNDYSEKVQVLRNDHWRELKSLSDADKLERNKDKRISRITTAILGSATGLLAVATGILATLALTLTPTQEQGFRTEPQGEHYQDTDYVENGEEHGRQYGIEFYDEDEPDYDDEIENN